jgi:DNA polymerase-4
MPLREAYRRCPDAVFLPVDFPTYVQVSERIKQILAEFSPVVEDAGLDEAYLDASHAEGPPEAVGRAIQARIHAETGLSCSIGIAPNKLLAKIASGLAKPGGLTFLTEDDVPRRIWPLPVRRLPGVGPKTAACLRVATIGDLAALSLDTLAERLGPAHGPALHRAACGVDDSPLVTHWTPQGMSRETTFEEDIAERPVLVDVLRQLAGEVVGRLVAQGYRARTVTVKLRFADFETHTRAVTLPAPTDAAPRLIEAALACFDRHALTKKVRLIGVRLGGLVATRRQGGSPVEKISSAVTTDRPA